MKIISKLLVCSSTHTVCEDTIDIKRVTPYIMGGIFDGCSSGIASKWASETLNHAFKNVGYQSGLVPILRVFNSLKEIKRELNLTFENFLSTAILFKMHTETGELQIRAFGDCSYWVNGERFDISENNQPDYMGYHLEDDRQPLIDYIMAHPVRTYKDVKSFVIASDGIDKLSISAFKEAKVDALTCLTALPSNSTYLERMWNLLKKQGWYVEDDLSIITYNENGP